jgi:hypothetical protein
MKPMVRGIRKTSYLCALAAKGCQFIYFQLLILGAARRRRISMAITDFRNH